MGLELISLFTGGNAVVFPILAFVLAVMLWTYVYAQHNRTPVNKTFLWFTFAAMGWLGTELLIYFPFARHYETAIYKFSSLFWVFIGLSYLEFATAISGRKRGVFSYLGVVTATVGFVVTAFTDVVISDTTVYEWGVAPVLHPVYHSVVSANTAIYTLVGMVFIFQKARATKDNHEKVILGLLLNGTAVAAGAISLLNVVLPNILGIVHIPRFGASTMGVFLLLVFYAIMKYRFLSISPGKVAEEIFAGVKVGILLLDRDGIVTHANREAKQMFPGAEGEPADAILAGFPVFNECAGAEIALAGETRTLSLTSSPVIRNQQRMGTVLMLQDITDQKEAEAVLLKSHDELEREVVKRTRQLREARRLETIGTLAGGIAHDFNNNLAAILGFSNAALNDLPPEHPVREDLHEVLLAASRGREIVHQIMLLGRKENKSEFKIHNLVKLLEETLTQLKVTTPKQIRVETSIEVDIAYAFCSSTQLSQVIMNLFNNACHALKDGEDARIAVQLKKVDINESIVTETTYLKSGAFWALSIEDNGTGIAPRHRQRIFDPFFTTKPKGEGTGLGLASCQVIIHNHDGDISVDSEPGAGSTFTVYLPAQEGAVRISSIPPPAVSEAPAAASDIHVLWVDDDEQILRMGTRLVRQMGFRVTTATSGLAALARFKENPGGFSLVVTDYSMPEMDGLELSVALQQLGSVPPIILVSGYGEDIKSSDIDTSGIFALLDKPVEFSYFKKSIRAALERG